MKERPIIFTGDSVRAILDGRKTQTRRVIHPQPINIKIGQSVVPSACGNCPYGEPGDRLWVREAFDSWKCANESMLLLNRGAWKSPMFMPRWASRLTLEITEVRVQRLQEMSEEDAQEEGRGTWGNGCRHRYFAGLWDSINAKRGHSWESNPWVWAVSFRQVPA
jgi:hypothetical protein